VNLKTMGGGNVCWDSVSRDIELERRPRNDFPQHIKLIQAQIRIKSFRFFYTELMI